MKVGRSVFLNKQTKCTLNNKTQCTGFAFPLVLLLLFLSRSTVVITWDMFKVAVL